MQNLGLLWGIVSSYRNDLGFERNIMAADSLGLCRWADNVLRFLKCLFHNLFELCGGCRFGSRRNLRKYIYELMEMRSLTWTHANIYPRLCILCY